MARKQPKNKKAKVSDSSSSYQGIEENEPVSDLLGYTTFLYGAPKVGKTTAALSWPKPVILAFEVRGARAFKVPTIKIRCWEHLKKAIRELKKKENRKQYKSVIIDTSDLMYKYCLDYCCEKYGYDHPSDQGWGKGWESITNEFLGAVLALFDLEYSLVFTSHRKETEIIADWEKYTRIDPTIPGPGRKVLLPYTDLILFMYAKEDKEGNTQRVVTTRATRAYEAGDRTKCLTDITMKVTSKNKDKVFAMLDKRFKKNSEELNS